MTEDTKTYYVWVTAASDAFAEDLVSKLVRRGYTVGPLARHLITQFHDNPACVVAVSVQRVPRNEEERKSYTVRGIYDEVLDVINHVKGKFWSLVVSEAGGSIWNVGNISIEAEQKKRDEELKAAIRKVN